MITIRNIQLAYVILIFLLILLTESSENLNHRSYREICGKEWHKEYTHLHNSVISGQRQGKYLISVPVHAGLADNVLGYVSGFLWALLSNRAYMILAVDAFPDQSQRTISFAFHSPHINWTAPTINQSLYDCMYPSYYNYPKNCSTNISYNLNKYSSQNKLPVKYFRAVNIENIPSFDTNNLTEIYNENNENNIFLYSSNRGRTYNIFNNKYHNETFLKYGLTRHTLFPCIFHYLFRLNDDICIGECKKTENSLLQLSRPGSNTITIGIQVRDVSSSTAPEHFFCVNTLIEYYKKQGKEVKLLLVSVNTAMQSYYKHIYGDSLLLPIGIPHKPEVVSDRSSSSSSNILYNKEEIAYIDRIAMQDSARDMRLLSLTDIQVISMSSGFGLVASMMKLSRNHIIFRVAKGWKKNCSANPSGDPIGYLVQGWSGLR